MYSFQLTDEQQEIREAVREFVNKEVKPVALKPARLEASERYLPEALFRQASQLGLRTLALPEALGGAGADMLTSCIVAEELAAGDVDFAMTLMTTSHLSRVLFDRAMSAEQRARFLPPFIANDACHLACAEMESAYVADGGANYHRPYAAAAGTKLAAARQNNGDWVVNGTTDYVANAAVAALVAIEVRTGAESGDGISTLLVARDTPGVGLRKPEPGADGNPLYVWHHGAGGELEFSDCKVPAANLLGTAGTRALAGSRASISHDNPLLQAMNLGVGRAAYEAALDYARLRVQGGRPIIEHQAMGALLAEIAIKLEVARNMVWKAAWAADHPEACTDRDTADLPLQGIARVFTSDAVHQVALRAAEVFGATGVMRDMPLQKYVHDALVFVHAGAGNTVETLKIAEAVAGYRRS